MPFPEYDSLDAIGLAGLVSRREVTPLELLEAALERADARNPRINAIVSRYDDEARRRARGPLQGPLAGVPFLIKDLMTAWKGHGMSGASRLQDGYVPNFDSQVVQRLEAAGLVLFGQTNSPEFGILAHTESALRGPCRNPWNTDHTPGGSSGGSAAAVAARIVPAAHGNDGGGSIRIPASHCGLFGLKPTRGRISLAPTFGEVWFGLASEGVLTRSVRDSALFLDLLSGPGVGDPYAAPPQARPYAEEVGAPPGKLRVAFTEESLFGHGTGQEARAAVRDAVKLLAELGHHVEEARPPIDRDSMALAYIHLVAAGVASTVDRAARLTGRTPGADNLEIETLALAAAGRTITGAELLTELEQMRRMAREVGEFFERHDLLVTPTVAQPPVRIGALDSRPLEKVGMRVAASLGLRWLMDQLFAQVGSRSFDATGFTMPFNQTGQPAMSVPLHMTAEGLPLGVQVVGRFGADDVLLRVAAQLEAARPWAARMPSAILPEPPTAGGQP